MGTIAQRNFSPKPVPQKSGFSTPPQSRKPVLKTSSALGTVQDNHVDTNQVTLEICRTNPSKNMSTFGHLSP